MLQIAICDDEEYYRENLSKMISVQLNRLQIDFQIKKFKSGSELLAEGKNIRQYTVIFLDMNMEGLSGLETAQLVRTYSEDVYIVAVTAFMSYAVEGYKFDVTRYLVKGHENFQFLLEECIRTILDKINYKDICKQFAFIEGKKEININKILYVESSLHKSYYYILEKEILRYSIYEKLNQIEEKLKKHGFIRIHQSYLVNIKQIGLIKNYKLIFNNGLELPVSKSKFKAAKEAFMEYKGEF